MKNLNLTPRAQKLIKEAYKIAGSENHASITYLHFFIAILSLKQDKIEKAFFNFKINSSKLAIKAQKFLKENVQISTKTPNQPVLTNKTKNLFQNAKTLSSKYDHKYVGLEHIFISLFVSPDEFLEKFLATCESFDKVIDFVEQSFQEDDFSDVSAIPNSEPVGENPNPIFDPRKYKNLNSCAINLNDQVICGKINTLHINGKLVEKLSEILCRKTKNNPIIVGEAGVGKTALVECLAKSIVDGKCSDFIVLKQIYSLDISMMIAGCKYRGEFEEKIKNILKEVSNDPNVILFIDEIHTIIGAGNPENGLDVANILKPYLARGEISCIGATTLDEYNKKIANDPALSRRFQIVKIEEPNKEQVFSLIKNIKNSYESFHVVEFEDPIIRYAIDATEKYIEGRFPDKALDLIDQVGSKCKLRNFVKSADLLSIEQKIEEASQKCTEENSEKSERKILKLLAQYEKAAQKMVFNWKNNKYKVTEEDILNVISDKTNIPIEDLKCQDSDKLKKLKELLQKNIIGQTSQIDHIYKTIVRAKAGFRNFKKPICSLFFGGPTGVGKTMTGKMMAEVLFPNKNNYIHVDMSEYSDKTAVNKIIGSAPGYIGFEKSGTLADKVRKNPYSLILFDEIQEADKDILFIIGQILEEGKINDAAGKTIDFSNCIVVLTSNVGSQTAITPSIGFNNTSSQKTHDVLSLVKKYFPSDLLNRIDEIIIFDSLNDESLKKIIKLQLEELCNNLKLNNKEIKIDEKIVDFIFSKIQFVNFGARQITKTVQRELQTLLAEYILENPSKTIINIDIDNNLIRMS